MADRLDALSYHELTKHSVASVRENGHYLDWDTRPLPFKIYSGLETVPLPRDFSRRTPDSSEILDWVNLARLLHFTGGIMRKKTLADGSEYYFRAAACTGALYHIDLYFVCGELPGLEAGVYHFGPHDSALHRLHRGDHRGVIVDASGHEPAIVSAPVVLICTSTFWRNAWKYQARTYRHCFWDNGTMLANLIAVAEESKVTAKVVVGFADRPVNALLGLDVDREVALSLVAVGSDDHSATAAPSLRSGIEAPGQWGTEPPGTAGVRGEVDYPAIRAAHAGSSFETPEQACQWRDQTFRRQLPEPRGAVVPLAPSPASATARIEDVIARRGSARQFLREPITYDALSHILRSAVVDIVADFSPDGGPGDSAATLLNDVYLIVNAVDGLAAGAYVYRHDHAALELLQAGDFRREAGHLDLGQDLAADASVNFYLLSDLDLIVNRLGNRGYRAAALEAAIIGGNIYLAAYQLGLGATGLTFFDDDVTGFFSPHAAGKGVMFLIAVGRSRVRRV